MQREALDRDDRHRVADPAVEGHREDVVERQPADREVLRAVRRRDPVGQAGREEQDGELVGDAVREVDAGELAPVARLDARLLAELAFRAVERGLAGGHAALRDLPRVGIERVAMLPDEQDAVVVVEDEDARREVREMDDAVDARRAVGAGHIVVPEGEPRVLVGDAPGVAGPRAVRGRGVRGVVVHPGIVAWAGRARPVSRASPRLGR